MVHQELAFCENLSVAENLCLGTLPARATFVSFPETERRARGMLADIAPEIDVRSVVGDLAVSQQQMVQIAAAVGQGARVIVFDEPTSSLTRHETARLYELIRRLLARGVTASTSPTAWRRSSTSATPSRCCATAATWRRVRGAR